MRAVLLILHFIAVGTATESGFETNLEPAERQPGLERSREFSPSVHTKAETHHEKTPSLKSFKTHNDATHDTGMGSTEPPFETIQNETVMEIHQHAMPSLNRIGNQNGLFNDKGLEHTENHFPTIQNETILDIHQQPTPSLNPIGNQNIVLHDKGLEHTANPLATSGNYTSPESRHHPHQIPASDFSETSSSVLRDQETRYIASAFQTFRGTGPTTWHSTLYTSGMEDDLEHECLRDCRLSTEKKVCHYTFEVDWYVSMNGDCGECPHEGPDCLRPHCVPADGVARPLVTVNHRMPGPSIQVCEDDEIVVDVKNELMTDSTSIHWHGLHQAGTPYMDGVPFLTQCPIQPGSSFRYHFIAHLPGTHYWHSHSGFQRTDGVFGSLVIRSREDPHAATYDVDDPSHLMVVTDWLERIGIDKFAKHGKEDGNMPYTLLINGLGKFRPLEKEGKFSHTPLYEYRVTEGLRYRFRSLSNSIQSCPIEISVDNHTMLVIASDAHDIQPVEVESLVIYGGERWDFVVKADQPPGVYWVKFRGLGYCSFRFAHQVALLRYEGVPGSPDSPPEDIDYASTSRGGKQMNKNSAAPGDASPFYSSADIRAYRKDTDDVIHNDVTNGGKETSDGAERYSRTPDHTFWLSIDVYETTSNLFRHNDFHPLLYQIPRKSRLYIFNMNKISFKKPNVPPLSQPDQVDQSLLCNATSRPNCESTFCHCSHILNVELGTLVELILVDTSTESGATFHPFHLHGYAFAVLGMESLGDETSLEAVKALDRQGALKRNFVDPPIKDTISVPDGGYTIIRFIADNPGYWLFHCHLAFHAESGMMLAFHVGERRHLPPVPRDFPTCGSFLPEPTKLLDRQVSKWKQEHLNFHLLAPHEETQYTSYEIVDPVQLGTTVNRSQPQRSRPQGSQPQWSCSNGVSKSFNMYPHLLPILIVFNAYIFL